MAAADARAAMVKRLAARRARDARAPGPPKFARHPRQDDYGNPTTKRPGAVNTGYVFPRKGVKGGRRTWYDLQGRFDPHHRIGGRTVDR
jgi:hypothetical protein